jgi:hypothetical protein
VVAGLLWLVPEVSAGSGGTVLLPVPGQTFLRPSGLQLQISSYWVEASGYRPVQIKVSSPRPATADRTLSIQLTPVQWYGYRTTQVVQFELVLPQGSVQASRTVSVPQYSIWQQWQVQVHEDGRWLKDLSATLGWARTSQHWEWTEAFPAMLFIDRDAPAPGDDSWKLRPGPRGAGTAEPRQLPNITAWSRLVSPQIDVSMARAVARVTARGQMVFDTSEQPSINVTDPSDRDILTMLGLLTNVELLPLSSLPEQWIDYTCFDLIIVSLDDLVELADRHPQAWVSLRRYITTGGNLLIYGVGKKFQRLGTLQALLDGGDPSGDTRLLEDPDGWWFPDRGRFGKPISKLLRTGEYVQSFGPGGRVTRERLVDDDEDLGSAKPKTAGEPLFCLRQLMLGRVVAIGPDDPLSTNEAQRDWMLTELGEDRWQWYRRHGVSQQRVNNSFWEFLIPGVGAAPVTAFLLIISAFVITIGPVNYWLLRKWKRLYLLLITVPLGAAVVTGCLLAYALLSDGLATRTRVRSYTEINPTSGMAVSWSRQSYYAGLAPSEGMVFPTQAAIFNIDPQPGLSQRRQHRLVWDDQQRLEGGYLPSRTTSQFLVIYTGPTQLGLEIERESGGSQVTVWNRLQTDIRELVVYDEGQAFWGEKLRAGGTVSLASIDPDKAAGRLRLRTASERPALPKNFAVPRSRGRNWGNTRDRSFPPPNLGTSLLERNLGEVFGAPPPTGRVYYAITEQAPTTVPLGVKEARQEVGFHMIKGEW